MFNTLQQEMANRLAQSLKRKSQTTCSRWAEQCRLIPDPKTKIPQNWSFKYHPWLREMHDSRAEMNVGMKSAQMGYTETVLNVTFFSIDILRKDCLYVLPSKTPDASDFSAARFDPALEASEHLANLFSDVKNIGHKRAGTCNLYIRGSKSRSGLKSIPTGLIVLDELEEMAQENIPLALERASGQFQDCWQAWMISTPLIDEMGIHKYYLKSSQEHFWFHCPACSRFIEFKYPESLVICGDSIFDPDIKRSHLICYECKAKLEHNEKQVFLQKGVWAPSVNERDVRGFHISQLYSSTAVTPIKLAESYFEAQTNPAAEQEFFNSKLGLPHVVDGARVTDADLQACTRGYTKVESHHSNKIVTMGVDVGKVLHIIVYEWDVPTYNQGTIDINVQSKAKLVGELKRVDFTDLDFLMSAFQVNLCVIDIQPERRMAMEFARRFPSFVYMCYYTKGVIGKSIHQNTDNYEIHVDRTAWLDMTLSRFRTKTIEIPQDISMEYKNHMKALVRIYEKDKDGNPVGRYKQDNDRPDHYAHASNYAEIALPLAVSLAVPQNIEKW